MIPIDVSMYITSGCGKSRMTLAASRGRRVSFSRQIRYAVSVRAAISSDRWPDP
jgi:hypothetical protein